jgi:hypothetical protein
MKYYDESSEVRPQEPRLMYGNDSNHNLMKCNQTQLINTITDILPVPMQVREDDFQSMRIQVVPSKNNVRRNSLGP